MRTKDHAPQDEIYGPLSIPAFCWKFIDTPEFQRLRFLKQLGSCELVYPSANHTRFEHCLGCAHLAGVFAAHFRRVQPDLPFTQDQEDALVLAALCHDLGHGPTSHNFDSIAHQFNPEWDHETMSCDLLRHIFQKYDVDIKPEIVEAACCFIQGEPYKDYPEWLSQIVANHKVDIDIDKFDYLARDTNRTLTLSRFEYTRLITNCRVIKGELAWKSSEVSTIERLFYNRNDLHLRVYQHRVAQATALMLTDILYLAKDKLDLKNAIDDPELFLRLDDRVFLLCQAGDCGPEAKALYDNITKRKLYKCVGELRIQPQNKEGITYSQLPNDMIEEDIAGFGDNLSADKLRIQKMKFRYGLNPNAHPILQIPFYDNDHEGTFYFTESTLSCIVPANFIEIALRVFVIDSCLVDEATKAFISWKRFKGYP